MIVDISNDRTKLEIYKKMIQYLLNSSRYTLENIACLSQTSIECIRAIYVESYLPINFTSELDLVMLYLMVLEFNADVSLLFLKDNRDL